MAKYEPLAACCPTSSNLLWRPESGSPGPALPLHGQFSPGSLANPGKRRIGGYNSDYRHNLAFSHCFAIQTLLSIAPVDERFYEQDEIGEIPAESTHFWS